MDGDEHQDIERTGDGQGPRWARFGPSPNQVIPLGTAEALLALWRDREPARFGALLAEVMTGTGQRFGPGRQRKASAS
jgi:hypothetical protein